MTGRQKKSSRAIFKQISDDIIQIMKSSGESSKNRISKEIEKLALSIGGGFREQKE